MDSKLIFDAHTHFNDESYESEGYSVKEMIKEANEVGVGYFLNCSFSLESSKLAIKQADENENIFVAIGIHPTEITSHSNDAYLELDNLANNKHVVAIGEIGLDYYYGSDEKEEQKIGFKKQIEIAIKHNLTVMMHIRDSKNIFDAYDDAIEIIKEMKPQRMIVHCFSANLEYAKKFIDLGCWINIGGAVTFKNAKELQEAATWIPLQKLLVETDAPYLTPHPFRGQKNFPKMIKYTVEKIANLKNISYEEVVEKTTNNAFSAFMIK